MVIRYNYLWADDANAGLVEGVKERPAAIVMVANSLSDGQKRVYVLPITHSKPLIESEAVELPAAVARAAGLDTARCWVVLTEYNEFVWPGFDLAIVPGRQPRTVAYGYLTPGFFDELRKLWLELDEANASKPVSRDE